MLRLQIYLARWLLTADWLQVSLSVLPANKQAEERQLTRPPS